jgi:hypothetical protein
MIDTKLRNIAFFPPDITDTEIEEVIQATFVFMIMIILPIF